ncbi:MAG: helix-turn-helix transcriptional regulator [bacterium]
MALAVRIAVADNHHVLITRVFLLIADPVRRAALSTALRTDQAVRIVDSEGDADVIVGDASSPLAPDGASVRKGQALTPRESEVLRLVAAGMGNGHIGEQLGISKSTVKYHLGAIYTKLGVHTRAEAVTMGIRSGIVLL